MKMPQNEVGKKDQKTELQGISSQTVISNLALLRI
jgi:hypothetical protein